MPAGTIHPATGLERRQPCRSAAAAARTVEGPYCPAGRRLAFAPALLPLVPAFAAAAAPIPLYNLYRTERLIFGALSSALSRPQILRACGGVAAAPTLLTIVAGRNPHAGTSRNDAGVRDKIAVIAPAARTATADHLGQSRAGPGKRL